MVGSTCREEGREGGERWGEKGRGGFWGGGGQRGGGRPRDGKSGFMRSTVTHSYFPVPLAGLSRSDDQRSLEVLAQS